MGYTLKIGELGVDVEYDNNYGLNSSVYANLTVKSERHDQAPAFGEPTDYTNERWPSYSSWSNFCEIAGLTDLFFPDGHSIRGGHPGAFPIEDEFMIQLFERYTEFKEKYPHAVAKFDGDDTLEENGALCRFEWLMYWCNWAHKNCEQPVFKNS